MNYKQCKLVRGSQERVTWLPEKFANKGKVLRLRDDGEWTDGWKVVEVWATETEERVVARERDYKRYWHCGAHRLRSRRSRDGW